MYDVRKCLMVTGAIAVGIVCFVVIKGMFHNDQSGTCEKAGRGLDDKLKETLAALEKATMQIQQVFEHLKPSKS